jgi:uncharacterized protein
LALKGRFGALETLSDSQCTRDELEDAVVGRQQELLVFESDSAAAKPREDPMSETMSDNRAGPASDSSVPPTLGPTQPSQRIEIIDVLRGFALFGVLLVNLIDLAGGPLSLSEYPGGRDPLDAFGIQFFVTARFRAIFSMLFGLGVAMQIQRAAEKGVPFFGTFARRMLILVGFGMLNFLFYRGDILTRYALMGMVLVPFYRLSVRRIVVAAAICAVVFVLAALAGPRSWLVGIRGMLSLLPPTNETCDALREAISGNYYANGSFLQVRMVEACRFPREAAGWVPEALGQTLCFFLVGLAFGKARFFHRVRELRPALIRGTVTVAVVGFAIRGSGYLWPDESGLWTSVVERLLLTAGIALVALGYAGALVLLFETRLGRKLLLPLAAMGRMALTVYIGQHVVAATMFQGWGLGWSNRPGLSALVALIVALYLTEVVLCNVWLRYFRFGPLEWIWRSITYGRAQPLRKPIAV